MRILLSVYSIKILQQRNEQLLSKFGGNIDFLPLFDKFTKHIYKNVQHWERPKHPKLTLTLPKNKKVKIVENQRCMYGFFEAGRDGDEFKVKDFNGGSKKVKYVRKKDSSLRNAFFYLSVPKLRKRGYLILQVPEAKGIKNHLEHTLREYMKLQGLPQYQIEISSLINETVFYKMIDAGLLKELAFTKYGIPETLDGLKNSDAKPKIGSGSIKTIYHDNNLGVRFKAYVKSVFSKKRLEKSGDDRSVIEFDNIIADELSVKIEHDGKQKTFHVENFSRTLPDIDVTDQVLNKKGELEIDKLIDQSVELIDDVKLTINKKDV
jgi:hypothetical protein